MTKKKIGLKLIYQSLSKLAHDIIPVSSGLQDQLHSKSNKQCSYKNSKILTLKFRQGTTELHFNEEIIYRADKSSIYVILNK